MMRIERPRHAFALLIEPRRLGVLASLTASLLLGACSQSPDLLQSFALKSDKTDTSDESTRRAANGVAESDHLLGQGIREKADGASAGAQLRKGPEGARREAEGDVHSAAGEHDSRQ